MRIALDVTPCTRARRAGIGWYAAHLANALVPELGPSDELLLCTRISRWSDRSFRPPAAPPRVRRRWFHASLGPRGSPDVFHGTDARLPGRCGARLVATVHDVFSLESSVWADSGFRERKRARYRDIAERAERIVFPSNATRRAYLGHFPQARERAAVVYEGVAPCFAPLPAARVESVRRRFELPERYALYVGEVSRRKNLLGQARGLAASGTGLPWVWVGRNSYGAPEIVEAVEKVPGVRVVRTGYLPAEALPAVYCGATLLTFASFSEGFGLPALEAMACGTPAVVADRGALPEITAGSALEVDPEAPEAIGDAIRRLVEDEALRRELGRRGLERAREFSWQRTARETLRVYRDSAAS